MTAQRAFYLLFRIVVSCFTAGVLVFFLLSIVGVDVMRQDENLSKTRGLYDAIHQELNGKVDARIKNLGDAPAKNPFKKFYSIELAGQIHEVSKLIEKQRIMFDTYSVQVFENQLKRIMNFAESSDVQRLMDEFETTKTELKNSAELLKKQEKRLVRQQAVNIALFLIVWIVLYLYFSRGVLFKKTAAA